MEVRIATPRLVLRRARPGDLDALHEIMSDMRAMRYWSNPPHATRDITETLLDAIIHRNDRDADDFMIDENGRLIGKAGAWRLPEVGFLLHPDRWGRGFAQEAMGAVIPHLFARHRMPELTADVDPRNAASIRLLTRLGFVETGRAERTMQWGDEWCDSVYFAVPRPR